MKKEMGEPNSPTIYKSRALANNLESKRRGSVADKSDHKIMNITNENVELIKSNNNLVMISDIDEN